MEVMGDLNSFPPRVRALPELESRTQLLAGRVQAFKLAADGCDVLFVDAAAGTSLPTHTHDTDNATFIVSGEAIVTVDGQEHRYGAGTWYETSANQPHAVRFDVDTPHIELRFRARVE
jgi:quercetin dioxygenase-like cupin family protein